MPEKSSNPNPDPKPDFEQIDREMNAVEKKLRELRRELDEIARLLKGKKDESNNPEEYNPVLSYPLNFAV